MADCFHCGLPAHAEYSSQIAGIERSFCCVACAAVAQAIHEGGLDSYYKYRDTPAAKADESDTHFELFDSPEAQEDFVHAGDAGSRIAQLHIPSIHCAACAWLIEKYLAPMPGLRSVRVNVSNYYCQIEWDPSAGKLSEYMQALNRIGYRPEPFNTRSLRVSQQKEQRASLMRLGLAGLAMMQVGMVGVALHAGEIQGIDLDMRQFLRYVSLLFSVPVIFFSALPFYRGALGALRARSLNMDVSVSLALTLAFVASVYATINNRGEVYYDSIAMFCFFLLLGRYLEMRARNSRALRAELADTFLPRFVERRGEGQSEWIALKNVRKDDVLRVSAGGVVPCDGVLASDHARLDESLLTGESEYREKHRGDDVFAGALAGDLGFDLKVVASGSQTTLAAIQTLMREASLAKPTQQKLGDLWSRYFIAGLLALTLAVYAVWSFVDPSRAFWVALSVLVVSCPCALSLAMPTALTGGINALRRHGFVIRVAQVLETLPNISHLVFDKTGTLTEGGLRVLTVDGDKPEHSLQIIAAMEANSLHPVARAFAHIATEKIARNVEYVPGSGIAADVDGRQYRFGKPGWACPSASSQVPVQGNYQALACADQVVAWVQVGDSPREGLGDFFTQLQTLGKRCSLLSGDQKANVDRFLSEQGLNACFENVRSDCSPREKLEFVQQLQKRDKVLMLGDGINDAPVLGAADLSIALSSAAQLAQTRADAILIGGNLHSLLTAFRIANKVKQVIRQNLFWALTYNAIAIPFAVAGLVAPWLAALGMSLSSLVVVLNAWRLGRS